MTKRQQSLLWWLDRQQGQLPTAYDVRVTAGREMNANPGEQEWLVAWWQKRQQLEISRSAPSEAVVAGMGAGGAETPVQQEENSMTEPTNENALPAVRPVAPELDAFARVGKWLAAAEKRNPNEDDRGAAAALRLYVARELGLSPLAGLKIGVTERGEIILPASLYRDLAAGRGYRVVRLETSPEACTAALVRLETGEEVGRVTFTIEMAKRAGLVRNGSGYEKYPERMLWARASKWVVEDFVPGLAFALSDDEAAEIANEPLVLDAEYDEADDGVPV